jgi:hypothetical protein
MTDAEVAAIASGGERALTRRIAKHSPTKAIGKLTSEKAAPPRIAAADMDEIQRTGRVPQRVRERLATAAESDVSPEVTSTDKDSPKVDPERRREG